MPDVAHVVEHITDFCYGSSMFAFRAAVYLLASYSMVERRAPNVRALS
jgi:hypothetical protein